MNGILVVHKPSGPTSRDVVNHLQSMLPRKTRIGHAGTLDPLASGVLLVTVGQATRLTEYLQEMPKTYRTVILFGAVSDTDDAAGKISYRVENPPIDLQTIRSVLDEFQGSIQQVPPAYSALKIEGRRAHELARKQKSVELQARPVRIDKIDILNFNWPRLELRIDCGKGTYIRSIARDLGLKLSCGGLVEVLVREQIGPFDLSQSLDDDPNREKIIRSLRPMTQAVEHLPNVAVNEAEIDRTYHGQPLPRPEGDLTGEVALIDANGDLVAIATGREGFLHPQKVFKKQD